MLQVLKNVWGKLTGSDIIKVSDMILDLEAAKAGIEKNLFESRSRLMDLLTDLNDNKAFINSIKNLGFQGSDKVIVAKLDNDLNIIYDGISSVIEALNRTDKMITKEAMTVKQAALIDISSTLIETMDFYNRALLFVMYNGLNDKVMIHKHEYKNVLSLKRRYQLTMDSYRDRGFAKLLKGVEAMDDVRVDAELSELREIAPNTNYKINPNGFNGNPFYFIGKLYAEYKIAKIQRLEDDKKLLELKIIEAREKEEYGDVKTETSQQIEFFEEKIRKIDKELEELRDV